MASGELRDHVHPTRDDGTVSVLSEVVGGPMGERAGGHRWWTPVRVLLALTALVFAVGMLSKSPCVSSEWQNSEQRYSHMCYSDLPYLYAGRGFSDLVWPYTDDQEVRAEHPVMEYPVGISYWAFGAGHLTWRLVGSPDLDDPERDLAKESVVFVAVNAIGLAAVALLTTWLLAGVNPRRPWDAAGFALAPALALTGLINWDLLAVVFVAGALWAWARDRPLLTGVLIGVGTAVKLYPLFLLGGVAVICLRSRRWRALALAVAGAAVSWLVVNAPAWLSGPESWRGFWTFNSERGADLGSLWLVAQQLTDQPITTEVINPVSWAVFSLWCLLVAALGLAAPSPPRLAQLGFLLVAGFLLVNKVYSPQYVLWLLPLAAMARPRWRDLLIWQAAEVLYFAGVWWYLGEYLAPGAGGDAFFYQLAVLLRVLAQVYLVAVVVRDVLRPAKDPVTRDPVHREPGRRGVAPDSGDQGQEMTTRSNVVAV